MNPVGAATLWHHLLRRGGVTLGPGVGEEMATRITGQDTAAQRAARRSTADGWLSRRLQVRRPTNPAVTIGAGALGLAILLAIILPPSLIGVPLGMVTVWGLSRHPRLGVLPAALLALLAVPYGRAAENGLAMIGGIPLRFHDGVVAAAILLSLLAIRSLPLRSTAARIWIAWAVLGVIVLALGLVEGNGVRDVLRDARWWFLYAIALLAIAVGVPRPAIIRGLLLGATIFAIVLIVTALLPAFDGGIKDRSLAYDWGRLRMQFSNSAFLLPVIAFVAHRLLRRPTRLDAVLLALFATAVFLSLTRMTILATVGVLGLSVLVAGFVALRDRRIGAFLVRTVAIGMVGAIALVAALGVARIGTTTASLARPADSQPRPDDDPVDRIFFQDPNSDSGAIERGRIQTYRSALDVVESSPIVGHGMGTLVPINFTFGGSRPSTPGMQPGVDNAFLTAALKAGVLGAALFLVMLVWPALKALGRRRDRFAPWLIVGWLGVIGITLTQSFATTGYGPFGMALLLVVLAYGPRGAESGRLTTS